MSRWAAVLIDVQDRCQHFHLIRPFLTIPKLALGDGVLYRWSWRRIFVLVSTQQWQRDINTQ